MKTQKEVSLKLLIGKTQMRRKKKKKVHDKIWMTAQESKILNHKSLSLKNQLSV